MVAAHEAAWASRWRVSDVAIEGDADAQQALRFAVYHLNSAANPADERVSIGARALTGDDYRGHVFWDTEIFLLPFYVADLAGSGPRAADVSLPHAGGARAKAGGDGLARGAVCLGVGRHRRGDDAGTGDRAGPAGHRILCGKQEQHISADVAYAVWQYWRATGDEGFLLDAGAEIMLETARFWASRATLEADGRHHIRGVIGPDEYHEHIDDNAFTNVMARWNIRRALEVAALLRERWPERWALLQAASAWTTPNWSNGRGVAETMATGLDPERVCSSSSPAISPSRTSISRTTPAVPCRWTWCSAGSELRSPR